MNKYLEKVVKLQGGNIDNLGNKQIVLEYYLTETDNEEIESFAAKKDCGGNTYCSENTYCGNAYGIEVIKKTNKENGYIAETESKYVKNISNCRASTKALLDKLIYNTVTPTELMYVLDNIVGED